MMINNSLFQPQSVPQSNPLMTALQSLAKFYGQNRNPSDSQAQTQNQPQQSSMQQQDTTSPLGGAIDGALGKLYTSGVANTTGLPWLSGGSPAIATSALANLFMG